MATALPVTFSLCQSCLRTGTVPESTLQESTCMQICLSESVFWNIQPKSTCSECKFQLFLAHICLHFLNRSKFIPLQQIWWVFFYRLFYMFSVDSILWIILLATTCSIPQFNRNHRAVNLVFLDVFLFPGFSCGRP